MRAALATLLLTLSLPAAAEGLTLYAEMALGIDMTHEEPGYLDHRTMGRITGGIECDGLYLELEHVSSVEKLEDSGYNAVWIGLRREWDL